MARLVLPVQDQARRGHPYRHPPAFPHGRSLGRRPRPGTWKCPLSHRGGLVSDRNARWSRAAGHARLVTLGSSRAAGHARLLRSGAPAERATGRARTKDPIPKIPRRGSRARAKDEACPSAATVRFRRSTHATADSAASRPAGSKAITPTASTNSPVEAPDASAAIRRIPVTPSNPTDKNRRNVRTRPADKSVLTWWTAAEITCLPRQHARLYPPSGPIPLGNVPPRRTGPQPPQDPVHRLPMITPPPAPPIGVRQQRLDLRPGRIGRLTMSHHIGHRTGSTPPRMIVRQTGPRSARGRRSAAPG
jgi:hypothetical protein